MASKSAVPWHGVREAPVVLVTGPEDYLADRVFRELRDRVRSASPGLEVTDIDAATYVSGSLFDYASPSLFDEPRMIRVSNGETTNDEFLADIVDYVTRPASDVIVLVRHAGGNRGKRMLDAIRAQEYALEVDCAEIKKGDRVTFAASEFKRLGVEIENAAVVALTNAFADDLAELAAACSQIASDALGKPITKAFVDRYYEGRSEVTAFAVADSAIVGDRAEALRLLRHAIHSGADPVPIIATFAMKLRSMAKVGGFSGKPGDAAKELGMAPWMVDKARRDLRGWTGATLGAAILEVAQADSLVKGDGRDPEFAVERMVERIASRGESA